MLHSIEHLLSEESPDFQLLGNAEPFRVEVPGYFSKKSLWMRLLGVLMLICFAPVILLLMLIVLLTSRGPAIIRQVRVGKDGKLFEIFKLRTMYENAEKLSGPVLCLPGDSRITPPGRLMRFLHLDELPQLVNIVRGEMCFVGPRPERPEIIAKHRLLEKVPGFFERTKVLPGVTGLAQINLPPDQTAECVIPKTQLDLHYIDTASVGLDLRILLCTAFRMSGVRQGRAVKLFRLVRYVDRRMTTTLPCNGQAPTKPSFDQQLSLKSECSTNLAYVTADIQAERALAVSPSWNKWDTECSDHEVNQEADCSSAPQHPR